MIIKFQKRTDLVMLEWVQETEGIWTYVVLFILAATPWLEVFLVIPLGVGVGLNPIAVAITGFIGNWIPVILIVLFFKKFSAWRARRKARLRAQQATTGGTSYSGENGILEDQDEHEQQQQHSKKQQRARRVWEKYGIPGYSLLAPILIGTDIAMILALAFGSPRRPITIWMTISLLLWSIILTVLTMQGINFLL